MRSKHISAAPPRSSPKSRDRSDPADLPVSPGRPIKTAKTGRQEKKCSAPLIWPVLHLPKLCRICTRRSTQSGRSVRHPAWTGKLRSSSDRSRSVRKRRAQKTGSPRPDHQTFFFPGRYHRSQCFYRTYPKNERFHEHTDDPRRYP